jgi:ATP-dependent DNA helicase HFM1/MER3
VSIRRFRLFNFIFASDFRFRIIALSATLPNLEDIGDWLQCRRDCIHDFNETYRPVPLQVKTLGYNTRANPFLFEKSLDDKVKDVIRSYSDSKPTIIFCSSKKNAENQAVNLCQQVILSYIVPNANIKLEIMKIQEVNLRSLAFQGYGYHHGGLNPDDRMIIEQLFQCGYVQILCCTSTLAQGMNFPAHLVIIKGTNAWRGSSVGFQRISRSEVIQMLGRAGRPGYDQQGKAVIMTSKDDQTYYSVNLLQADQVESQLESIILEGVYFLSCLFS